MKNERRKGVNGMAGTWKDHVDWEAVERTGRLDEDDVWHAIADAEDLDYSEIADGDILDWL